MTNTTVSQKINCYVEDFTSSYITLLKNDRRLTTANCRKSYEIAQQILACLTHTYALRSTDPRFGRLCLEHGNKPMEFFLIYKSELSKALQNIDPRSYFSDESPWLLPTLYDSD